MNFKEKKAAIIGRKTISFKLERNEDKDQNRGRSCYQFEEDINKTKKVSYMGGSIQSIFTKINHISPKLSDFLLINQYSRILKRYLG